MEEKIQEKKLLSAEEIEAQTLLELPDRQLMQVTIGPVSQAFQFIITTIELALG